MTPEDRRLARDLITRGKLTVEQVTQVRGECEKSGRPFAKIAVERGLIDASEAAAPPRRGPGALPPRSRPARRLRPAAVLIGSVGVLLALLLLGLSLQILRLDWGDDEDVAERTGRFRAETDRRAAEVRREVEARLIRERRARAALELEGARTHMAFVEERLRESTAPPDLTPRLVDASLGFTAWLDAHPNDALVLVERARAYELRKNFKKALRDLERAVELRPGLAADQAERLEALRARVK